LNLINAIRFQQKNGIFYPYYYEGDIMPELHKTIPVYISRFKEAYPQLEKDTTANGMTGSQRRDWLRVNAREAFSEENIDKISTEKAIELFNNFSSIVYNNSSGTQTWANSIVERGILGKAKELLYGSPDFLERYSVFLGKDKIKDVGEGIASEILCYQNPEKFGIITTSSTKALIILGFTKFPYQRSGGNSGTYAREYFTALEEVLQELRKDPGFASADFITLDYFLYFISLSKVWQLTGGRNGQSWRDEIWQKEGIAGYGTTGIEEKYGDSICSADERKLAQMYADAVEGKSAGYEKQVAALLNQFINKVNVGDVLVINQGTTAILGYGVVTSGPLFSKNHFVGDPQVYRKVAWVWDLQNLNVPIPEDMKSQFGLAISPIGFKQFQKLIPKDIIPVDEEQKQMNEIETKMMDLLKNKRQIILYGPPGTGKTYYANEFIKNIQSLPYKIEENSLLDQRVFSLTTYAPKYENVRSLKIGEKFVYDWTGRKNWQRYYDELQEGDPAIVYDAKLHKFTTVVRCVHKAEEALEFVIISQINGVTFAAMKEDPVLSQTDLVRASMAFSLRVFKEEELKRIIELSPSLDYDMLGVRINKIQETIENKEIITFHPSFGYEDFIEGLRPFTDTNEQLRFRIEDGIFKKFAKKACNVLLHEAGIDKEWTDDGDIPDLTDAEKLKIREKASAVPFYLIIDEINRGDMSRIFGELITLLEADKRYGEKNEPRPSVQLPCSKKRFAIPPNLLVIGTMNTADKSIALVDIALRRRFGFIEMMPDYGFLKGYLRQSDASLQEISDTSISLLETINRKINASYDRDHQIGHSYLTRIRDAKTRDEAIRALHFAWYYEILPLLQEYFYDSPEKLSDIVGKKFITLDQNRRAFSFNSMINGEEFLSAIQEITKTTVSPISDSLDE